MGLEDLEGGRMRLSPCSLGNVGRERAECGLLQSGIPTSHSEQPEPEESHEARADSRRSLGHQLTDPADQCHVGEVGRGRCGAQGRHGLLEGGTSAQEGQGRGGHGAEGEELSGDLSCPAPNGSGPSVPDGSELSSPDCEGHVASPELSRQCKHMSDTQANFVRRSCDSMLPDALQSLVATKGPVLIEVACAPDSILSHVMQQTMGSEGAAVRCAHWNQCDVGTNAGVRRVLKLIDEQRPQHVWISPECGPYSIMQNVNQRNPQQVADLESKRREALKQYVGCCLIFHHCVQRGIHATWEWSQSCQAWRLPIIQRLVNKYQPFFSIVRGCQVNLRDDDGSFIQKGWKLMTTHQLLSRRMDLPCSCEKGTPHVKCEGKLTRRTAFYTHEFAKRVCDALIQGNTRDEIHKELHGHVLGVEGFGEGTVCGCEEGQQHGADLKCLHCLKETDVMFQVEKCVSHETEEAFVGSDSSRLESIRKRLYLLHAATGHGHVRHLIQALKRRGAPREVIQEAERFKCSVCAERSSAQPRNVSSLEPQPPKWSTVSCDMGVWTHPHTNENHHFVLCIDEGSRFRIGRVIVSGQRKHVSATQFIECFRSHWTQYFGHPHTLRVDPDGSFRSHELNEFCDRSHIFLDLVASEAHWKIGICEQAIQGAKSIMTKLVTDDPDLSPQEALAEATRTFNNRELVRGYSPIQHALGRAPDELGRFFGSTVGASPDFLVENPTGELQRNLARMKSAEEAFLDWTNNQQLQKAMLSKSRRRLNFLPGDLVFIWRHQLPLKTSGRNTAGRFIGPARILAVEKRRDQNGDLIAGSAVWVVRGRRLLKCCPEQLRHASQREQLLEELHSESPTPWDFTKVARELGGNDYDDVSAEIPPDEEWHRAADPSLEWQPQIRCRGKRAAPMSTDADMGVLEGSHRSFPSDFREADSSSARPSQRPRQEPEDGFLAAPPWWESVTTTKDGQGAGFWESSFAAVEVGVDMPSTRNQSEKALNDMSAFLAGALKKRAVEVSEKHLTKEELAEFQSAKAVEVTNFLAAKAFEALPPDLKPDMSQVVKMRWVLTWKHREDGSRKAKARAVLLGFQDPKYSERATMAPTTTRLTRQLQLQISASKGFRLWKGDVTGAFLQGRPYPDELFCLPCPEILTAMGLPTTALTRVKRACYGLVDAPLEWYRSVSTAFQKLGLTRTWSDPCCWIFAPHGTVRGIISAHVDDFVFSGSDTDQEWQDILQAIRTEFKWSDWETKAFTQCGVYIEQDADFSISLSQEKYVDEFKYINIRAHRRKEKHAETDDYEKSQLRSLLGGVSWRAQQVAPHFSAEVGLLLSEINRSTVETLNRSNQLLHQVKNMRSHRLKVHSIPLENLGLFAWCDAAKQNRCDGSSTAGIVIGASSLNLLQGSVESVSLLAWHSSKITRICRSPGSSEAIAAVNAEDLLYFVRFQFQEMLGSKVNVRNINEVVNQVAGCVITDSRNVYDKLSTEVLCMRGAEKRTDLELLSLKEAQVSNHVVIRWVHSEVQLANSLTKSKEMRQLNLFYDMKHSWCIVEDEHMSSARKRKQQGIGTFTHRTSTRTSEPENNPSPSERN